jgi:hypothetical protein
MAPGSMLMEVREHKGDLTRPSKTDEPAAFGIFARALPQDEDEFLDLRAHTAGLDLADSITVDGHKLLNVVGSPSCSCRPTY